MTFRVIPPLPITSAMLVRSDVPEPDVAGGEQLWNAATTYAVDAVVINKATHRKFSSLKSGNTNNPLPVWPSEANEWWYDIGATNRWAMFDLAHASSTTYAGPWTVVIAPGVRVDSLALRGLVANRVVITVRSGGVVVYEYSVNLDRREVRNAYDYCFAPFETQPNVTRFDLPPYAKPEITVTLSRVEGRPSCQALAIGTQVSLGEMLEGAQSDALDFSIIERDKQGVLKLEAGRTVPKLVPQIICDKTMVKRIRELRDANAGVPLIWSGISSDHDPYAETVDICGPWRRFTITLKQTRAEIGLELENI